MVENSLAALENESPGAGASPPESYRQAYDRIGPPQPLLDHGSNEDAQQEEQQQRYSQRYSEALWQNGSLRRWQRKRQVIFSYTTFPSLARDWGAGIAPSPGAAERPGVPTAAGKRNNSTASRKQKPGRAGGREGRYEAPPADASPSPRRRAISAMDPMPPKAALNSDTRESLSADRVEEKASAVGVDGDQFREWLWSIVAVPGAGQSQGDSDAVGNGEVEEEEEEEEEEEGSDNGCAEQESSSANRVEKGEDGGAGDSNAAMQRAWEARQATIAPKKSMWADFFGASPSSVGSNGAGSSEDSIFRSLHQRFVVPGTSARSSRAVGQQTLAEALSELNFSDEESSEDGDDHEAEGGKRGKGSGSKTPSRGSGSSSKSIWGAFEGTLFGN